MAVLESWAVRRGPLGGAGKAHCYQWIRLLLNVLAAAFSRRRRRKNSPSKAAEASARMPPSKWESLWSNRFSSRSGMRIAHAGVLRIVAAVVDGVDPCLDESSRAHHAGLGIYVERRSRRQAPGIVALVVGLESEESRRGQWFCRSLPASSSLRRAIRPHGRARPPWGLRPGRRLSQPRRGLLASTFRVGSS